MGYSVREGRRLLYHSAQACQLFFGGTPLSGGKGSISGTIVGALIMGVLTNMLRLNNVDSNVEMMIKAVIIVLAVAVQRERNDS